jgi:hypothetical protein
MQAGMTLADIRRSERMAQLPKELHETILAEVMRRKRLAEIVAWTGARRGEGCESAREPSEASLGGARATMTIGRRRACHGDGVEPGLQARASSASPGSASPR